MDVGLEFTCQGAVLTALPSGALWWAERGLYCVSDLHLGKAQRIARRGGGMLPPYENHATLQNIQEDIDALHPQTVVCLGDSFDDLSAAQDIDTADHLWITRMQAGRRWIWIEGNHDPGPVALGGTHLAEFEVGPLTFRHIANPAKGAEVSGHYHPKTRLKVRGRNITRRSFLVDQTRVILPAFGTYTGGLWSDHAVLQELMSPQAFAILVGERLHMIPMPRV